MLLSIYNLDSLSNEPPVCDLENGEHIIGRGDLLKCHDKRVSRNHALIKISDDSATITSTHQNPCFYQSANSKTIIILPKDSPVDIGCGDKFGLFPDQFWFKCHLKIEFVENNKMTDDAETALNLLIDTTDNASRQSNTDLCNGDGPQPMESQCMPEVGHNNGSKRLCDFDTSDTQAKVAKLNVECALNEHTLQENITKQNILEDNSLKDDDNVNKNETGCVSKILPNHSDHLPQEIKIEDEDIKPIAENVPDTINSVETDVNVVENILQEINTEDENVQSSTEVENPHVNVVENILEGINTEDETVQNSTEVGNPDEASGSGTSTNVIDKKAIRERCWYGTTCYRKNPQHKAEYSHPGNSDYDSDPTDDRPTCPYGPSCYRKNKDHQKEYKHPRNHKKPPPRKRKVAKPDEQNSESSQDDYDYDDPFFDDASSDEYQEESWSEDSDDNWEYSQNTNDEDTNALIKEAKRFTRTRKNK